MQQTGAINLYQAEKRRSLLVKSAPCISLLENLGVRPGTRLTIQNRYFLGGPVLLKVEDTYIIALGKDIAKQITVEKATAV